MSDMRFLHPYQEAAVRLLEQARADVVQAQGYLASVSRERADETIPWQSAADRDDAWKAGQEKMRWSEEQAAETARLDGLINALVRRIRKEPVGGKVI